MPKTKRPTKAEQAETEFFWRGYAAGYRDGKRLAIEQAASALLDNDPLKAAIQTALKENR